MKVSYEFFVRFVQSLCTHMTFKFKLISIIQFHINYLSKNKLFILISARVLVLHIYLNKIKKKLTSHPPNCTPTLFF